MYVGNCNECIYGFKCPCGNSVNSVACLTIAKKGKPKQTNGDKIRAMSDEELADFIEMKQFFAIARNGTDGEEYTLQWLQEEVEDKKDD